MKYPSIFLISHENIYCGYSFEVPYSIEILLFLHENIYCGYSFEVPYSIEILLFLHENIYCGYSLEVPYEVSKYFSYFSWKHLLWVIIWSALRSIQILLFLHENIYCGYSLEVPQYMFSWRNKKILGYSLLSRAMAEILVRLCRWIGWSKFAHLICSYLFPCLDQCELCYAGKIVRLQIHCSFLIFNKKIVEFTHTDPVQAKDGKTNENLNHISR